jgi:hypothetical protein
MYNEEKGGKKACTTQKGGHMSKKSLAGLFFVALLFAHALIIADDVQAVIEDPNQVNKPGEILKLAIDITRYFG